LSIRQIAGILRPAFHATAPSFGCSQRLGAVEAFLQLRNFKTTSKSGDVFQFGSRE